MKNAHGICRRDDGVALVIVLGLLSILTIMAVAFASAMLIERLAAWNHANSVRAEGLVQTGLVRAMRYVNTNSVGLCYPTWNATQSVASVGAKATDLMTGEATNTIPVPLLADAKAVANNCYWLNIIDKNGKTNGRVAYVIVNASGLIDINLAGGRYRGWSTNLAEIDPGNLLQPGTVATFTNDRLKHVRYETMPEAMALNGAVKSNAGFNTFSLDIGRDQYFDMANASDLSRIMTLGSSDAETNLTMKFDINAISRTNADGSYRYKGYTQSWNFAAYSSDPLFMNEYWTPLKNLLSRLRSTGKTMVERPDDVAWNIVNYLDPDRIPQGAAGIDNPWAHSEGGESIPLINEIVLQPCAKPAGAPAKGSNYYEFVVELWYPFAPLVVTPADKFSLWVGVFTNKSVSADVISITNCANVATNYTFSSDILNMSYGGVDFLCVTSPAEKKICFPTKVATTNPAVFVTNYLPIGIQTFTDGASNSVTVSNAVWFLSRVYKQEPIDSGTWTNLPVDEAMGYDNTGAEDFGEKSSARKLKIFTNAEGFSVCDPRSNGQIKYWTTNGSGGKYVGGLGPYSCSNATYATLGNTNKNCDPWSRKGSGLPIFSTNGPMVNIGELGYIWRSNLDDEEPADYWWWRTINLMHFDEGAALLDMCTVRRTNASAYGLVAINSKQTNAVRALFNNMKIGYVSGPETNMVQLNAVDVDKLVSAIITNGPFMSFRSMFTTNDTDEGGGGDLAMKFRAAGTNAAKCNGDIYGEDVFRRVCELITFRQNVFIVTVAAQVFGGDGQTVVGEKRGSATIYRDSYTGKYFIRSFKWLSDQ